jgi:phosphatidylglycerophosphate synthase
MNFLPFPKEFDQNEWFIIISALALLFLLYKKPKRFSWSITILLLFFTVSVARVADHLLAGPHKDFYDIMDTGKYELFDLFSYIPYAPFGYVFIYIYDKFQLKGMLLLFYIICCSVGSSAFEYMISTPYIHFLHYKNWNAIISFPVYLVVQPLTILFFHFIKSIYEKSLLSH